ncbi:MAG: DUF460 domain-containing protein [Thermofilaceae archaeon]|nr:DUF460 domain-containing protein [Thermofilaceae archaeon]MCX8180635.1 DUF460 domain-containing protein [Thermofilaceae archaeon]MDW8003737.1 DUF460 domain-containing protein [Thermofilaceae archaeon]
MDLLSGESPESSRDPQLAYALLIDGNVKERGTGKLSEILALAEKVRVEAIAVDNVYELASSFSGLQALMNVLIYPPKIVQVTIIGGRTYPLQSLAASLGLGGGKLSPSQAAEVAARLCYIGIGSELLLFENNETRITVSKGRSPIQGGMSAERYKRSIESKVLRKTKEIKNSLDERKIDYDLFITRGAFGIERSVFIVYTSREDLFGVVKPIHDHDIQVKIELIEKKEPSFLPLSSVPRKMRRNSEYLIVGVDPGVSSGVAALTLDGKLKLLISGRELSRGQLIRHLMEVGNPIIIASDTSPPPSYLKKLATMLDALLIEPEHSLSIQEKRKLVSEYIASADLCLKVKNSHQRDALAAALHAYWRLKPKLSEAREKVEKLDLDIPVEDVIALVARGNPIWEAIREVSRTQFIPEQKPPIIKNRGVDTSSSEAIWEKLNELQRRIRELEEEKQELTTTLKVLEEQFQRLLNAQSYTIRREKEIENLRNRLDLLTKDYSSLKEEYNSIKDSKHELENLIYKLTIGELIPAIRVSSLSVLLKNTCTSGVAVLGSLHPGDEIYLSEISKKVKIKAIVCEQRCPEKIIEALACQDVALIHMHEINHKIKIGDVYLFQRQELEKTINEKLKNLEINSKEFIKKSLKNIIDNYRTERIRTLKDGDSINK